MMKINPSNLFLGIKKNSPSGHCQHCWHWGIVVRKLQALGNRGINLPNFKKYTLQIRLRLWQDEWQQFIATVLGNLYAQTNAKDLLLYI